MTDLIRSWVDSANEPFTLDSGHERTCIEAGDTLALHSHAQGNGYRIGFGPCTGSVGPASTG